MAVRPKLLVAFTAAALVVPLAGNSGYRDDSYFGSGYSFRVVRTLNVPVR